MELAGKRVTVMGLGRHGGGVEAARYAAGQGAEVTVTDRADARDLADSLHALAGLPLHDVRTGGHDLADFTRADVVIVNPAVRPGNPYLERSALGGVRITTAIELFLEACPAQLVGVTGSNGKSTTAAMLAAILQADGRRAWLGGNLGGSLLPQLTKMTSDDWVVLELSSFQLARLSPAARLPRLAVVTNCSPNHLDWHADLDDYVAAKQRLPAGQQPGDAAVLNTECPEVATWTGIARGTSLPPLDDGQLPELPLPGEHNRQNARLAAAAALHAGCRAESLARGLRSFRGLPHRLQPIAGIDGLRFYNDSMATTPESVMAALRAIEGPIWLLAGGGDKGADFGPLAAVVAERARGACFFGATGERLRELSAAAGGARLQRVETLTAALAWCLERAEAGDAILLSPGCSSLDQFRDYAHRGTTFVEGVRRLSPRSAAVPA